MSNATVYLFPCQGVCPDPSQVDSPSYAVVQNGFFAPDMPDFRQFTFTIRTYAAAEQGKDDEYLLALNIHNPTFGVSGLRLFASVY